MPYLLGFQAGMMMGPVGLDATVFGASVKPIGAAGRVTATRPL